MVTNSLVCYLSALILMYRSVSGVELTFDLPDSARDCFHEDIKKNTSVILEYQVKLNKNRTKSMLVSFFDSLIWCEYDEPGEMLLISDYLLMRLVYFFHCGN